MAVQAIKVKEMWWLIGSTPVVPGSNPASLTVENSEDRQSHCIYCEISGQRGRPPPKAKKDRKNKLYPVAFMLTASNLKGNMITITQNS